MNGMTPAGAGHGREHGSGAGPGRCRPAAIRRPSSGSAGRIRRRSTPLPFAFALSLSFAASPASADRIGQVLAHPPVHGSYQCSEHPEGQLPSLGDALGTDCVVTELVTVDGRTWSRAHRGDGRANEDWFGWRQPLLAPCDCEVVRVARKPDVNEPGVMGKPPASFVVFRADDGTHLLYAHVR